MKIFIYKLLIILFLTSTTNSAQELVAEKGSFGIDTKNKRLQNQTNTIVKNHYNQLSKNGINNIAVLVLDVNKREVLSYVGNAPTTKKTKKM